MDKLNGWAAHTGEPFDPCDVVSVFLEHIIIFIIIIIIIIIVIIITVTFFGPRNCKKNIWCTLPAAEKRAKLLQCELYNIYYTIIIFYG
jgi:hypothetical protein